MRWAWPEHLLLKLSCLICYPQVRKQDNGAWWSSKQVIISSIRTCSVDLKDGIAFCTTVMRWHLNFWRTSQLLSWIFWRPPTTSFPEEYLAAEISIVNYRLVKVMLLVLESKGRDAGGKRYFFFQDLLPTDKGCLASKSCFGPWGTPKLAELVSSFLPFLTFLSLPCLI